MKKTLRSFFSVTLIISLMAGCGESNSGDQAVSSTASSSNDGTKDVTSSLTLGAQASNTVADNYDGNVTSDGKTVVRVGITDDPGTLDPFSTGSSNGRNASIKTTIFQCLGMIQGVGGELAPEIASGWTKIDDVTYDIEINETVHDSEGNPITADDVVWSYQKAIETLYSRNASYIQSIEKNGDYSVRLVLTTPAVTLFERVMQSLYIVSQKAYEESPDNMATDPVCTGPYVVKEWVNGSSLVLEKNQNFWETDEQIAADIDSAANVDRIEYYVIKEASQMSIALETGKIDMAYNIDSTEAQRFMAGGESAEGFNMFLTVNNLTQTMFLNVSEYSAFYNNLPLRQAVLYAIDSQGVVDGASNGYGIVCHTFGSDQLADYQDKWTTEDYYNYNPEKAAELLKESGFDTSTKLRIVTNNSALRNKIAQIVQSYLFSIGIQSEILQYDDTLFNTYKNEPDQWDILLDNCGTSDTLMGMWRGKLDEHCSNFGSANMAKDATLQELVDAAQNPSTNSAETVDALHQYVKDNAYVYGIYNQISFTVTRNICTEISLSSTPWLMPAGCTYIWN